MSTTEGTEVEVFAAQRPRLLGLAYRMLGTMADAEDVVQEAWVRWQRSAQADIAEPAAWLTTVTTRIAVDNLRASQRRREDYVGPWLPEPVVLANGPEEAAELADSLTLGFLTLLDTLSPVERAVFLLADVFRYPFAEIADAVDRTDVACRQIASRARRRLREAKPRHPTSDERRVVDELLVYMALGDVDAVLARLAPDAVLLSDGGPHKRAARRPVVGADRIARFYINLIRRYAELPIRFEPAAINGDPGLMIYIGDVLDIVAAFEIRDDKVQTVWLVLNPDKLGHVTEPVALR